MRERWWMALLAMVLLLASRADGQPLLGPAAGSIAREGVQQEHGGHGWVIVPEPRGGGWLLVHLPPRSWVRPDGRLGGSEAGTARVALRLSEAPEALAGVGDEVYLAFRASPNSRGGMVRQVYMMSAIESGLGDLWVYEPSRRLASQASLPGEGVLVGFVGTPVGPAALIDRGPREGGTSVDQGDVEVEASTGRPASDLGLVVLWGGEWRSIGLPEIERVEGESDRGLRRFMLAGTPEGLTLLATRPARLARVWRAGLSLEQTRRPEEIRRAEQEARHEGVDRVEPDVGQEAEDPLLPIAVEWIGGTIRTATADDRGVLLPTGPLSVIGGRIVYAHTEGEDRLGVYSVGAEGAGRLVSIDTGVASGAAGGGWDETPRAGVVGVVGWTGSHRVGLVLAPAGVPGDRGLSVMDAAMRLRIVEVSADTGGVVFDGASRTGSPLDRGQFQAVLLVVLGVTTILLIWAIRGGSRDRVVRLPEGCALAEPGRRLVAGGIDYLVASVVTGWILGIPLLDVVSLRILLSPEANLESVGVLAGTGILMSALMEGLVGWSPGKRAMGLRVVAVTGPRAGTWRGPGVGRALARSLFKWIAAPVAIFGLGRSDGRHGGDLLGGTAVAVRVEDGADERGVE